MQSPFSALASPQAEVLMCYYAWIKSQEEKHAIDSRNRQAAPVRRLRNRMAKEQCYSPSDTGIQRVLRSKTKGHQSQC